MLTKRTLVPSGMKMGQPPTSSDSEFPSKAWQQVPFQSLVGGHTRFNWQLYLPEFLKGLP